MRVTTPRTDEASQTATLDRRLLPHRTGAVLKSCVYAAVLLQVGRTKLWTVGLLALALVAGFVGMATPARAQMLCGVFKCDADPGNGGGTAAPECTQIGTSDRNPANTPATPTLDTPLIERGPDGRIPWGFAGLGYPKGWISPEREFRLHDIAGSTLAKVTLAWDGVEGERGNPQFGSYDRKYCALLADGIQPVFMIYSTPDWAADPGVCSGDGECLAPPSDAHLPDLRRFAEQLAIRYPQAAAFEVWNEPNHGYRWIDPDPARYTQMLRAVFEGVNNGDPGIPVLGGAMSVHEKPKAEDDGTIPAIEFIDRVFAAGGGDYMDAVSLHAYPRLPGSSGGDRYEILVGGVRSVAARYDGPGRRHIWVSETGGHVEKNEADWGFTEEAHAEILEDIYRRSNASGDVDAVIYHQLMNGDGYGWVKLANATGKYMPRPVYCRFADMFGPAIDCNRAIRF